MNVKSIDLLSLLYTNIKKIIIIILNYNIAFKDRKWKCTLEIPIKVFNNTFFLFNYKTNQWIMNFIFCVLKEEKAASK